MAFILFGLLILSFAVWGIGDIFRGAGADPVIAEVGSVEIATVRFQRALQVELQRLQARLGPNVDQAQLRRLGVPRRVLASMINETLFSLGAHGMGIAVSDQVISRAIRADTSFHRRGRFDRATYRAALSNAGLSERGYEESLRRDSAQRHLTGAITADQSVPKSLLNALYRYRNERRVARVLFIPTSAIAAVGTPDTGALIAFHKKHARRFTAPEYRKLTAAILRPRDLAAEIEVPEDKLRTAYEDRKAEFDEPERRKMDQILVGEEALAKKIHAALRSGRSFKSVATGMAGHKDGPLALG
ncbi:peptidylprolyl isomerase, partial [candidate division KSB1 bacterium]|nr:peptidylprolyl isomerase [candidate division KSB1 bacterium]